MKIVVFAKDSYEEIESWEQIARLEKDIKNRQSMIEQLKEDVVFLTAVAANKTDEILISFKERSGKYRAYQYDVKRIGIDIVPKKVNNA